MFRKLPFTSASGNALYKQINNAVLKEPSRNKLSSFTHRHSKNNHFSCYFSPSEVNVKPRELHKLTNLYVACVRQIYFISMITRVHRAYLSLQCYRIYSLILRPASRSTVISLTHKVISDFLRQYTALLFNDRCKYWRTRQAGSE